MAKEFSTNGMPTMNTRQVATNEYGVISDIAFYPKYRNISASATLTYAQTGSVFLVYGGTAAVVVTTPAISDGPFHYRVINGQAQDITITAATADTMIGFNDVDLDSIAVTASGSEIGAHFCIDCDGTKLFVLNLLASTYQAIVPTD